MADLDDHALANMDWTRLTQNHRHALSVLAGASDPVQPQEPRAFKRACHDLWGFRLAERHFREGAVAYTATFLGKRVHRMLSGATPPRPQDGG